MLGMRVFWAMCLVSCALAERAAAATVELPVGDRGTVELSVTADGGRLVARAGGEPLGFAASAAGASFSTCVRLTTGTQAPRSTCRIGGALTGSPIGAPDVLVDVPRPAGTTVVSYEVVVADGGTRVSSWPADGIAAAGVLVPAEGPPVALTDAGVPPPPMQGVPLSTGLMAGINTGAPESFCHRSDWPATTAPPPGVEVGDVGGVLYEIGEPLAGPARGAVILLHGGGWRAYGRGALEFMRADAERWRARGWRSVNASLPVCADSPESLRQFVAIVRRRWPGLPVCAVGSSSGAHLAASLARREPGALDCVVAQGGPLALGAMATATADVPRAVYNLAVAALGATQVAAMEQVPAGLSTRFLIEHAETDALVPLATAYIARDALAAAGAPAEVVALPPGPVPWVHAAVDADALAAMHAREDALAAALSATDPPPPPPPPPPDPEPDPDPEPPPPDPEPEPEPPPPAPGPQPDPPKPPDPPAVLPPAAGPAPAAPAPAVSRSLPAGPLERLVREARFRVLGRGTTTRVAVVLRTSRAATADVGLRLGRVAARRLGLRPGTVVRARASLPAGGSAELTLRPGRRLRRLLGARRGIHTALLDVRFVEPGGASTVLVPALVRVRGG